MSSGSTPVDRSGRAERIPSAIDVVEGRIDAMKDFAEKAKDAAMKALEKLGEAGADLEADAPDTDTDITIAGVVAFDDSDKPESITGSLEPDYDDFDEDPDFKDLHEISDSIEFPTFDIDDPALGDPELGELVDMGDKPTVPELDMPEVPDDDTGDAPPAPELNDVVIPPPPEIDPATFDKVLEEWAETEPGEFVWEGPESEYVSDIWSDLLGKVLSNIQNGGTGLDPQIEDAIYQNHINRAAYEHDKQVQQASSYWSARGFTMPPGMLSAKINEINAEITRNNLQVSREIAVNQAELAQKNTHFFIDKGVQLEGMLRDFFIKQVNTTLEASRAIADNAIAIYSAKIQKHNLYLDIFKTHMAETDMLIRIELAKLEQFKIEMEAAQIGASIEKTRADIYSSEVAGYEARVRAYTAKIQATLGEVDIEKAKMQIYAEEIKGYLATVEINKGTIQAYEAELRGEQGKVEAYKARVSAFMSEVEGKKAELEGEVARLQGDVEYNKGQAQIFSGLVDVHNAHVQTEGARISGHATAYQAKASMYSAEASSHAAYVRGKMDEQNLHIKKAELELQRAVAEINAAVQVFSAIQGLKAQTSVGSAQVGSQLVSSALSAVNVGASIGYTGNDVSQESLSESHQHSYEGG